jgi:glycosyltransferase involved in cell wall biosynthesis
MLITVAICTLDRAESLRRTLNSLAAMRLPSGDVAWEVVIVNNNCSDDTDLVIKAFADRLPIRREFEPQRGLSRARNRAVDAASGDYIVWTDDDVVVDPGWLAAYVEAFHRRPEAAVFGGRIIPRYAAPVPKWLFESETVVPGMLAIRDFGDAELPLSIAGDRLPYGPNFAVLATAQRAFRYDPQLGHGPRQRRRGEETDVVTRILQSGATGYWVPAARVEHCLSPGMQTTRYVASFCATIGETEAFRSGPERWAGPVLFGAPHCLWRRMIKEWVLYKCRWLSPPPVSTAHLVRYSTVWGIIRYLRSHRK